MIWEIFCYIVVFVSEALTAWLYLHYLFSRKSNIITLSLSLTMGYTFLFFLSFLQNTTLNALACCAVNIAVILLNYRCSLKAALLHTSFLCVAMTASEILMALIISILGYSFSAYTNNLFVLVTLTILSKLMYLVISVIASRIFAPHKHVEVEPQNMLLFCCMPTISAIIAVFSVYVGMNAGITEESSIMMLITVLTLLIVNLIFLSLYNYLEEEHRKQMAFQIELMKSQADASYYETLEKQYTSQRILVHDIKKHLSVINSIAQREDAKKVREYVAELNTAFQETTQAKLCTEPILNYLLLKFQEEANSKHVSFYCDVRENCVSFMDGASITALFGNLLTNAIESAAITQERQVEVCAVYFPDQSITVISIINSCDIAPIPDGRGFFHSLKPRSEYHGIGLRSIDYVVKKYDGASKLYFSPDEKRFHHIIQLPVPQLVQNSIESLSLQNSFSMK